MICWYVQKMQGIKCLKDYLTSYTFPGRGTNGNDYLQKELPP